MYTCSKNIGECVCMFMWSGCPQVYKIVRINFAVSPFEGVTAAKKTEGVWGRRGGYGWMCRWVPLTIGGRVSLLTIFKLPIFRATGQPSFTNISMKALRLWYPYTCTYTCNACSITNIKKTYQFWGSHMSCILSAEQNSEFHTIEGYIRNMQAMTVYIHCTCTCTCICRVLYL